MRPLLLTAALLFAIGLLGPVFCHADATPLDGGPSFLVASQVAPPIPIPVDPESSIDGTLKFLVWAAQSHSWRFLLGGLLICFVAASKKFLPVLHVRFDWLNTDRGGAAIVLGTTMLSSIGIGLMMPGTFQWSVFLDGLSIAFTAAGGYVLVKKLRLMDLVADLVTRVGSNGVKSIVILLGAGVLVSGCALSAAAQVKVGVIVSVKTLDEGCVVYADTYDKQADGITDAAIKKCKGTKKKFRSCVDVEIAPYDRATKACDVYQHARAGAVSAADGNFAGVVSETIAALSVVGIKVPL